MMRNRLAVALAVAALAVPAFAQVKKVDVQGVQNFNQIDAVFACGGATDATGVANLKKQGFASIISFRLPTEQGVSEEEAAIKTTGIKYVHLPLNGAMPDPKVADEFLAAVSDKANQPAYIHCGGGGRARGDVDDQARAEGWLDDRARRGRGQRDSRCSTPG
jgi:protein tyrosine phosphatase (PTP) superfamily phosphohydrolase (DUF442 family)